MLPQLAALLLLGAYLGLSIAPVQRWAARWARDGSWPGVLVLLVPYLLATQLRGTVKELVAFALYLLVPALLVHFLQRGNRPNGGTLLAALAIWFPLEPELFLLPWGGHLPKALTWIIPPDAVAPLGPLDLPVTKLTAVLLVLYLFVLYRPLSRLGYTFRWKIADVSAALVALVAFMVIAIPLGLALHFLGWAPRRVALTQALSTLIAIFFFTGIPEELLFRGLIQNALGRWFRPRVALLLAALIFGAAHLDNATAHHPVPNWTYALLAALAGLAYGWVWQRRGKVTAAAITHALVDWLWWLLLGG